MGIGEAIATSIVEAGANICLLSRSGVSSSRITRTFADSLTFLNRTNSRS